MGLLVVKVQRYVVGQLSPHAEDDAQGVLQVVDVHYHLNGDGRIDEDFLHPFSNFL